MTTPILVFLRAAGKLKEYAGITVRMRRAYPQDIREVKAFDALCEFTDLAGQAIDPIKQLVRDYAKALEALEGAETALIDLGACQKDPEECEYCPCATVKCRKALSTSATHLELLNAVKEGV